MRKVQIDHAAQTITTTSSSDGKLFNVVMHYSFDDALVLAALEWAIIRFNVGARKGAYKPSPEVYHILTDGSIRPTDEQIIAGLSPKAKELLAAQLETEIRAKVEAELKAKKKAA